MRYLDVAFQVLAIIAAVLVIVWVIGFYVGQIRDQWRTEDEADDCDDLQPGQVLELKVGGTAAGNCCVCRFSYAIGDKLRIVLSERVGTVKAINVSEEGGEQYQVRYVDNNGLVVDGWFTESELSEHVDCYPTRYPSRELCRGCFTEECSCDVGRGDALYAGSES